MRIVTVVTRPPLARRLCNNFLPERIVSYSLTLKASQRYGQRGQGKAGPARQSRYGVLEEEVKYQYGMNPRWLVLLLNSKLASSGSVISRTEGKRADRYREYQLLDTVSGEIRYLSLKEVEHLARGIVTESWEK